MNSAIIIISLAVYFAKLSVRLGLIPLLKAGDSPATSTIWSIRLLRNAVTLTQDCNESDARTSLTQSQRDAHYPDDNG